MTKRTNLIIAAIVAALAVGPYAADATAPPGPYAYQSVSNTDVKYKAPANNKPYACTTLTINDPGIYRLTWAGTFYSSRGDDGTVEAWATLTTNPTAGYPSFITNPELTAVQRVGGKSFRMMTSLGRTATVVVTTPTTYTLVMWESSGGNWRDLQCLGEAVSPTTITAERV